MPIQVMVLSACLDSTLAHAVLAAYLFAVLDERSWRRVKSCQPCSHPRWSPAHSTYCCTTPPPRQGSHPLLGRHPQCHAGLYAVDPVGLEDRILAGPLRRVHGGHVPDCPFRPDPVFVQQHIHG